MSDNPWYDAPTPTQWDSDPTAREIPADELAEASSVPVSQLILAGYARQAEQSAPAYELREAERAARIVASSTADARLRRPEVRRLMAEYDERGRKYDAARDEVERLRRALAGHLFDGESLSTREALRSELIEQGLKDSDEVAQLRGWYEQVRAENERLHRDRDLRNDERLAVEGARAEVERLRRDVLHALRAEDDDPVAAALFVREAADKFAARATELEPIAQRALEVREGRHVGMYDSIHYILTGEA